MNKNNDIDKIFRDSLKNYRVRPPESAWQEIEKSLGQKEKKRVLPLWFLIAAGLALLVGSYTMVNFIIKDGYNLNEHVATPVAEIHEQKGDKVQAEHKAPEKQFLVVALKNAEEKIVALVEDGIETPEKINLKSKLPSLNEKNQKQHSAPEENTRVSNGILTAEVEELAYIKTKKDIRLEQKSMIPLLGAKKNEPSLVAKNNEASLGANNELVVIDEVMNGSDRTRDYQWVIGGSMAPLHAYRDLKSEVNSRAFEYFNSVETPILSYTGGFSIEMKTHGRLSIESGVYFARLGQTVKNLPVVASNNGLAFNNLNSKSIVVNSNSAGPIYSPPVNQQDQTNNYIPLTGYTKKLDNYTASNAEDEGNGNTMTGELKQHFNYLEIPMVIKYKLIDKDIDISLLGGISANILVGNEVMLLVGGDKLHFGETGNIKNLNYSSSVGLGFDYAIINNLNLSVDPVFKYYLTSINEGSSLDYHPYSMGVYTGITYMF